MRFSYYVIISQVIIVFLVVMFFLFTNENKWASSFYGGVVGILNTLFSALVIKGANSLKDVKQTMAIIFLFSGLRFVAIGVFFYLGFNLFNFDFVPMVITFALLQLGYFLNFKQLKK